MHNSQDFTEIDSLISAYLTRVISDREMQQLQSWLDESEENMAYFRQQQEVWLSAVVARESSRFNSEQAFRRFLSRTVHSPKTVKPRVRFTPTILYRAVAAVALLVLLAGGAFWLGEQHVQKNLANVRVEVPLGSRTRLYLPDGTLVWLNAGSKLSYSQNFGVGSRDLRLEGEGYFEVTKNKHLPFAVTTREMRVTVLGTKFNFRNYAEDEEASVTLLEGRVGLDKDLGRKEQLFLRPNQRMVLNKKSGAAQVSKVEAYRSSQWTKGLLSFNQEKLADIARELERSYNVDIVIKDDTLSNFRFYGSFTRTEQSIHEVLEMLASTNKLTYQIKGRKVLLYAK